MTLPPVLLIGADGFIGRHIAYHLRDEGADLLVSARNTRALEAMGFRTLRADLQSSSTHDPEFWRPHLAGGRAVVNAAGLLTGSEAGFEAVHQRAPEAIYAAMEPGAKGVLISAIGIGDSATAFARWRRAGETAASGLTILRPGLVMGDTSYGGSSLARALAAMPLRMPVVGDGAQVSNPIHAADLPRAVRAVLTSDLPPGPHAIGGPERITQAELLALLRGWMGLPPVPVLPLPEPLARRIGRVGDALRLGPVSATSVAQFAGRLEAETSAPLAAIMPKLRGVRSFVTARPAGSQDLWHARAYLLRPVLRLTLALLWLASGVLGLALPPERFLHLTPGGVEAIWIALARLGGLADLALAWALMRNWRPQVTAAAQFALVVSYTLAFTALDAGLWALPLGGLLKNLPILALIAIWAVLERER